MTRLVCHIPTGLPGFSFAAHATAVMVQCGDHEHALRAAVSQDCICLLVALSPVPGPAPRKQEKLEKNLMDECKNKWLN